MKQSRIEPLAGQESVWDYPRPPRIEVCRKRIIAVIDDFTIVDSCRSFRVLETSHPPVFYIPQDDIRMELMRKSTHGSFCEWKGHAHYYAVAVPDKKLIENAAWCYPNPTTRFESIAGFLAFYPSKFDECYVEEERVRAQEGDFYGGWITSNIVGPFKGGPMTLNW